MTKTALKNCLQKVTGNALSQLPVAGIFIQSPNPSALTNKQKLLNFLSVQISSNGGMSLFISGILLKKTHHWFESSALAQRGPAYCRTSCDSLLHLYVFSSCKVDHILGLTCTYRMCMYVGIYIMCWGRMNVLTATAHAWNYTPRPDSQMTDSFSK